MTTSINDELWTENEVSKQVRVAIVTLRRWRASGGGPPFVQMSPRAIRYRKSSVLAWIEKCETSKSGAA